MKEQKRAITLELARIAKLNGGRIDPHAIVEAARSPESPLHRYFEWDDTSAAEKYRISQARELLRSVRLKTTIEDRTLRVPAYIRDPEQAEAGEPGYIETARLRTQGDLAHEALVAEFQRVRNALLRARQLAAYFDLSEAVDSLMADLEIVASAARKAAPLHAN